MEQIRADEVVAQLAELFGKHPAWRAAAARLEPAATSTVFFSHRPGEPWHLERREGYTYLEPGRAVDPDFVFLFTPPSVKRLAETDGSIGSFAVELFRLMTEGSEKGRIQLRIAAPFQRLVRRGYLGLLAAGGLRVLAFGAARGVRTLGQLRALVEALHRGEPEPWERDAPPPVSRDEP
ncbi:MAG: hypothetical protein QNK04_30605 [Myxococcota bacterium]|nr:hypothetical protein [Myxococcota bacterium]